MKLVKYIFFTTILFLSFQKSYANCENLVFKNIDGFRLVSENLLEDKSRQIVWRNTNISISLVQFNKQSSTSDELNSLGKSVALQLSNIARNKNIKYLNPKKNNKFHSRLYRLFFVTSLNKPKSMEVAGIFSDTSCTEIIRFTEINPLSNSQSLEASARLMNKILALKQ